MPDVMFIARVSVRLLCASKASTFVICRERLRVFRYDVCFLSPSVYEGRGIIAIHVSDRNNNFME